MVLSRMILQCLRAPSDEDAVAETHALLRTLAEIVAFVFLALVGGYLGRSSIPSLHPVGVQL